MKTTEAKVYGWSNCRSLEAFLVADYKGSVASYLRANEDEGIQVLRLEAVRVVPVALSRRHSLKNVHLVLTY